MKAIIILAKLTFREAIRRRILLAGLVLGIAFLVIVMLVGVVFLLHEGGQRALAWLEARARSGYALSNRAVALAAEFSKKPFRRPHSPPAP